MTQSATCFDTLRVIIRLISNTLESAHIIYGKRDLTYTDYVTSPGFFKSISRFEFVKVAVKILKYIK